jgi:hypothetical protein
MVAGAAQVRFSGQARDREPTLRHTSHHFDDGVDGFAPGSSIGRRWPRLAARLAEKMQFQLLLPNLPLEFSERRPMMHLRHLRRSGVFSRSA